MEKRLELEMLPQPDDAACGPTCLHAVYRYHDDPIPLAHILEEIPRLKEGGTLAVFLACHALRRGYRATIYTYNLQVFDPTWFASGTGGVVGRLKAQAARKDDAKLQTASRGYVDFLERGGKLKFKDLTTRLIRSYLRRSIPILTGLSATYLYRCARELGPPQRHDDLGGEPTGHFVVLCGYDKVDRTVLVADPLLPNPVSPTPQYEVDIDRLICSILLGILTYDANLLVIEPRRRRKEARNVDPVRRQQPR